jgi:hypothetical protein
LKCVQAASQLNCIHAETSYELALCIWMKWFKQWIIQIGKTHRQSL